MKKITFRGAIGLAILCCCIPAALALPGGYDDNGRNYMEGSSDLSRWSVGIYTDGRARDVSINDLTYRLDTDQVMGYVGYDLWHPVTLYVTGGSSQYSFLDTATEGSTGIYGLGLKLNLLDHEIMDPTLLEDQLRLNLQMQYTAASLDWGNDTLDVGEVSAALTLGLINDIEGDVLFLPNGIGIFAGAVYADTLSSDVTMNTTFGFTVGLEVYYSEKITLEVRMESFDEAKYLGGIHLRL